MKFLKASEKKRLVRELEEQFGIGELPYTLLETGKGKIRGFSGSMSKDEIRELEELANVEIVGIYLIRKENRLRLSLDGSMILKEQVKKNVVDIDNKQVESWMNGGNLELDSLGEKYDKVMNKPASGEGYDNGLGGGDRDDSDESVKGEGYDNKIMKSNIFVVRHEGTGDFLGCGIWDGKKLINHVPKERRIRRG